MFVLVCRKYIIYFDFYYFYITPDAEISLTVGGGKDYIDPTALSDELLSTCERMPSEYIKVIYAIVDLTFILRLSGADTESFLANGSVRGVLENLVHSYTRCDSNATTTFQAMGDNFGKLQFVCYVWTFTVVYREELLNRFSYCEFSLEHNGV